jgi:hypothetical protein
MTCAGQVRAHAGWQARTGPPAQVMPLPLDSLRRRELVIGWKKTIVALLISITALSIPSALLLTSPDQARAASLSTRLTHTRSALIHARARLRRDRAAYAAALAAASAPAADTAPSASPSPSTTPSPSTSPSPAPAPVPTPAQLRREAHRVRVLQKLLAALRHELDIRQAAAHGNWMPLVRDAAKHNRISALGLRRLMTLESGGRVNAQSGSYHGLYQYAWSTWHGAWNPWRAQSLYNGEAQIRATALAIKRGWGRQMWPNTYPRAF